MNYWTSDVTDFVGDKSLTWQLIELGKGLAQLLREFARQIQRDAIEIGIFEQFVQTMREQLED